MRTGKDKIILEDISGGINPFYDQISYIDKSGMQISIPYRVLVRST